MAFESFKYQYDQDFKSLKNIKKMHLLTFKIAQDNKECLINILYKLFLLNYYFSYTRYKPSHFLLIFFYIS